jgi:hypothetical protein
MTTFLQPDEGINVDFAESRQKDRDRVACFLHLRDLVYMHREAASVSTIAFVETLEASVIAEKAAREKRLGAARERDAERRREADRQKAAAERAALPTAGVDGGLTPSENPNDVARRDVWACNAQPSLADSVNQSKRGD